MDFLNVSAFSTSASTTKVLVLDGNTVKSRTAAQVVTDGGGGGSTARLQTFTLFQSGVSGGSGNPYTISAAASTDGFGFPNSYAADSPGQTTNRDASVLRTSKFILDFNPTNFRISAVCAADPTYYSGTPTSGDFGLKLQWSLNNSTWNDFTSTLGFRTKVAGDFITTTGTVTVTSFSSVVYFRCITVQTLSPATAADASVRNLVVTFWN